MLGISAGKTCRLHVYIFVRKDQNYDKTDISLHCTEKVLKISAIQLETKHVT
jgi:hypothetical protein